MGLFGGDSDSETNQFDQKRDNSAILDGMFSQNTADGASSARDNGVLGNGISGITFSGIQRIAESPVNGACYLWVILGAIIGSAGLYWGGRK